MIEIEEYIKLSREERRKHLDLNEDCILRGGGSVHFRGLLAHHLNTSIPFKTKTRICLCHACHNGKCSNPNHLYFGTDSDNIIDSFQNGRKSIYDYEVEKYGADNIHKILSKRLSSVDRSYLSYSSDEVNERLKIISDIDLTKFGWLAKVAKRWKVSHTQVRRFIEKYYKGKVYKRHSPLV